jgi:hypothetical protein
MMKAARNLIEKRPWVEWLIPSAFCLILLAQMLFSVRQMSQTADEAIHLYAGYRVLQCGDYDYGREHPPLAKMLVAIPLLVSNPPMDCAQREVGIDGEDEATRWLYSQDTWWHLLMEARAVSSLFAVALCLGIWIAARRMFGLAVAVVSTAIVAFEPNILGHGALLLNNVLLSALFLFTVFAFYLWTRRRSQPLLVLTGVFTGMALLTKHSAVLLPPTLCLLAVSEAWLEKSNQSEAVRRMVRNLGAVAAISVIAAVTIWCGFGMRYAGHGRRASDTVSSDQLAKMRSPDVRIVKAMRAAHLLPQAYLDGLIDERVVVASTSGSVRLLGKSYAKTPWFYLPLATTIECTVPFLVMLVLGGAGIIAFGEERRKEILFLLLPALLYLAVSIRVQRTGIGLWHLFPMLPFLVIASAAGCVFVTRRYRWGVITLVCLLALHATSSLRAYPNYLSYANELWGGPPNLYKHLPLTDLNQTFWQVSRYMEQHPNTPCWLVSEWYVPPEMYKIPCVQVGSLWAGDIPARANGIVFVSSTWLHFTGFNGQPADALAPFAEAEPTALLGGSAMLVYEGEYDTHVAAARALNNKAFELLSLDRPMEALLVAKRSIELAQSSSAASTAHYMYGVALALTGQPEEGLSECTIARNLALADGDPKKVEKATQYMKSIAQRYNLLLPPGIE